MRFLVSLLLDTMWGFVFVCFGAGWFAAGLGLDISHVMSPQDAAWLLGATVALAAFLRLPVWLLLWLEKNKREQASLEA